MARIRSIKPEFPLDQRLGSISRDARLLYILLWPICDDLGLFRASPALLSSMLFPYDEDAGAGDLQRWLTELIDAKQVVLYEAEEENFGVIPTLRKHQRPKSPHKEPQHPVPPVGTCAAVDLVIRKYASEQYRRQYFQGVIPLSAEGLPHTNSMAEVGLPNHSPIPSEGVPETDETRSLVEEGRVEEGRGGESRGEEGTGEESVDPDFCQWCHYGYPLKDRTHTIPEDGSTAPCERPGQGERIEDYGPPEATMDDDTPNEPSQPEEPDVAQLAKAVLDGAKELGFAWRKPHRFLTARLRAGATVAECVSVVQVMLEEWTGKIADDGREMEDYLRQETLFREGKFEGYLRKAKRTAANRTAVEEEAAARAAAPAIELPEPHFPGLWDSVLEVIQQQTNPHVFSTYFQPLRGFYQWNGPFTLVAVDEFAADWVNDYYLDFIDGKIRELYAEFGELQVIGAPEAAGIVAALG